MNEGFLNNKADLWNSNDSLKLEFIGKLAYLKNTSKNKFFVIDNSFNVTLQDLGQNNTNLLWKQGRIDNEDYFTLNDPFSPKVLTATKSGKLIVMERKKNVINIGFISFNCILLSTLSGIPITSPITTMVGSLILVISLAGIVFCIGYFRGNGESNLIEEGNNEVESLLGFNEESMEDKMHSVRFVTY
jgi:hypothetical protein